MSSDSTIIFSKDRPLDVYLVFTEDCYGGQQKDGVGEIFLTRQDAIKHRNLVLKQAETNGVPNMQILIKVFHLFPKSPSEFIGEDDVE